MSAGLSTTTYEKKKANRNGVLRMGFTVLSIFLEVVLIISLFTSLNRYAEWINVGTRVLSTLMVLVIYGQHKTSAMKMPWIILILVFPVVGLTLYFLIGLNYSTHKMRKRYEDIDSVLLPLLPENREVEKELHREAPDKAAASDYLWRNAHYPVYSNTDVVYYDEAAKGLEAQLQDLAKAESFIFMEYHAIENAQSWKRIEDILVDRVRAGVEVRVFYDDMGSIGFVTTSFAKHLQSEGIQCRVFNPFMPGLNVFLNNRDHRKITVIDGRVGFTGGYNLANEYFNVTHPYGIWKDTGIRIEGDAVRSLTITFLEMWNAVKNSDKDDVDFMHYLPEYPYQARETGFVQPYADSPMDDEHVGEETYITMADKANRYVYYITPYLIITDEMMHALCLAAKRGVDVRIITPGIPDKRLVYGVTRSFYNRLVRNGVRIYEWTPGFCHAKMSVSDDLAATCGTINLDYRSLYHHFENGCYMVGCDAVHRIKQDFDAMFPQCRDVTEKYRSGRSNVMRLWQLFLRLFAELM